MCDLSGDPALAEAVAAAPSRLLEALSPEDKAAYRERLADVLRRADNADAEMIDAVKRMTRQAADSLQARWVAIGVGNGTEWDEFITQRMQGALGEVARELARAFGSALGEMLPAAFENGDSLTLAGIGGAGFDVSALPGIAAETVKIASVFSSDLITNVEAWVLDRVNVVLRQAFVAGSSPWDVMQGIARSGIDSGPWKSVAYRGEIICRTEMARIQGLGAQRRMSDVVRDYPDMGLRKVWLVAHILEWPCKTCEPLENTVWDVDDPEAPEVPAHPGCRCCLAPVLPGLSREVKALSQDSTLTARQRDASVVED